MPGRVPSSDGPWLGTGTDKHVACCLPTSCGRVPQFLLWRMLFLTFLGFLVSSWCLVHMESTSLAGLPVVYVYKTWISSVCLPAGQALWAEVGGSITL